MASGFHSVHLVLPDRILKDAWLTVADGRIKDFGQNAPPRLDLVDGGNHYLAPALIDIHVHGGNGSDFLDGTEEAFHRISAFHLAGGTAALCPTLATASYEHIERVLATYQRVRETTASRLLPMHLEGPHLAAGKAGAQDPALLIPPCREHTDWLASNASFISQITLAPELPNALEAIATLSRAGIRVSLGHTEATEAESRLAVENGATKVTHLFNAMSSARKIGLFRQPGLTEYALIEDRLTCEIIADGFHVAPSLVKLAYRVKGPARIALVSDALAGAGLPLNSSFRLGKLECRVDQGYCTLADRSALSGSATRLIDHVRFLALKVGIRLEHAIRMATLTPAQAIGVADRIGSIAPGKIADLILLDNALQLRETWIAGKPS